MESILYSIPSHTLEGIHEYLEFSIGDELNWVVLRTFPWIQFVNLGMICARSA